LCKLCAKKKSFSQVASPHPACHHSFKSVPIAVAEDDGSESEEDELKPRGIAYVFLLFLTSSSQYILLLVLLLLILGFMLWVHPGKPISICSPPKIWRKDFRVAISNTTFFN